MDKETEFGIIRFAKMEDIKYIIHLSKKESKSIGFIPKPAYERAITGIKIGGEWSNISNDKMWVCECNKDLVGFCLASFGKNHGMVKMGRIAQICLQTDARMMQRGRMLLDAVIEYGKTKGTLRWSCGCADDLPSNLFWQTMGWIKLGDRKGISPANTYIQTSNRKINIYRFDPYDIFLNKK